MYLLFCICTGFLYGYFGVSLSDKLGWNLSISMPLIIVCGAIFNMLVGYFIFSKFQ